MKRWQAQVVVEHLERWLDQRERANRPQHNRAAKHPDDDVDFKAELAILLSDGD